jgi:hypothetical protein
MVPGDDAESRTVRGGAIATERANSDEKRCL